MIPQIMMSLVLPTCFKTLAITPSWLASGIWDTRTSAVLIIGGS